MNKARAMLDALMGPGRDVLDKGPKNEKFKESSVCKSFLVGFCPLDSSMLGGKRKFDVCSRIHSDLMRDQLNAHPDAEKLKREYQTLFLRDLEHVARECDGHIANERQRIREDVRKKKAPLPVDVNARLSAMKREAEGLVAQAKALDDDRLRDKESLEARAKEIMADRESYMEVETKKAADAVVPEEVCEVCGTAYEGPQEKENHKKFKVHKVYEKVRDMIPELKKTVDELEKQKREEKEQELKKKRKEEWEAAAKEPGSEDKKRSRSKEKEKDKERDRDKEKDRDRDRDREKDREKEKERDKEKDRDRERDRDRDRDREKRDKSREKSKGDGGKRKEACRGRDLSRDRSRGHKRSRSRSGGSRGRRGRRERRRSRS